MESDSPPIESTFPRKLSSHALRMESDDAASVSAAPTDTFYPRSPHGERLLSTYLQIIISLVSIHALRMESDSSTIDTESPKDLSIHALRMESDKQYDALLQSDDSFYPRSPHGERPMAL